MKNSIYIRLLSIVILLFIGIGLIIYHGVDDLSFLFLSASLGGYFFVYGINLFYPNKVLISGLPSIFFKKVYIVQLVLGCYILFFVVMKDQLILINNFSAYFGMVIFSGLSLNGLIFIKRMKDTQITNRT